MFVTAAVITEKGLTDAVHSFLERTLTASYLITHAWKEILVNCCGILISNVGNFSQMSLISTNLRCAKYDAAAFPQPFYQF